MLDPQEILNTQEAPAPSEEAALAAVPPETTTVSPPIETPSKQRTPQQERHRQFLIEATRKPRGPVSNDQIDAAMEKFKEFKDAKKRAAVELDMGYMTLGRRIKSVKRLREKWEDYGYFVTMNDELDRIGKSLTIDAFCLGRIKEWTGIMQGLLDLMKKVQKKISLIVESKSDNGLKRLGPLQKLYLELHAEYRRQRELFIRVYKTLKTSERPSAKTPPRTHGDIFERRRVRNSANSNGLDQMVEPVKRAKFALAPKIAKPQP